MSSVKPNDRSRQINRPQKIPRGLIVAGGNGAKLFEFGKKVFDQMAGLIEMLVVGIRLLAMGFGGDNG